ncbi:anti-sigma factor [Arthrobacter sp. NEB 688]|uniref:anti-sigma factor family protein n=1 Tax=Arthrobacter sp. NEB 688 TaxID=904039 RepID=UPI00156594A4|nr:anti-sigma factor [Arthrobacter sp. NEB 688]QKE83892.1 hypothetical protein HL663_08030 [Arthrobacter sp. NEB 688]
MTEDHDELRHLLGPWVLGGLDAADRARFGAHLDGCPVCRAEVEASTPVAGLLRRVPPQEWARPATDGAPPGDLAPLLLAVAAQRRAGRRRTLALGALAATVALVGGVALGARLDGPQDPPPVAAAIALAPAPGSGTTGRADLAPRPWGTQLALEVLDLPSTGRYALVVHSTDGTRETGATWSATDRARIRVVGATSLPPARIAVLEVVSVEGGTLAEGHAT